MRKLFVALCLIFSLSTSFVWAEDQQSVKAQIAMNDLTVYSTGDKKNLFGLKDKAGNIIVEAQYKKLIRLGILLGLLIRRINMELLTAVAITLLNLNTDTLTECWANMQNSATKTITAYITKMEKP